MVNFYFLPVKTVKKSAIPGVTITQFVEDIPKGGSTPDFERKPITLTLQEGETSLKKEFAASLGPPSS